MGLGWEVLRLKDACDPKDLGPLFSIPHIQEAVLKDFEWLLVTDHRRVDLQIHEQECFYYCCFSMHILICFQFLCRVLLNLLSLKVD